MSGLPTDRYTKFILTVIAAALVWLCVQRSDGLQRAHAQVLQNQPQPVVVVGVQVKPDEVLPIRIASIARGGRDGREFGWEHLPVQK